MNVLERVVLYALGALAVAFIVVVLWIVTLDERACQRRGGTYLSGRCLDVRTLPATEGER